MRVRIENVKAPWLPLLLLLGGCGGATPALLATVPKKDTSEFAGRYTGNVDHVLDGEWLEDGHCQGTISGVGDVRFTLSGAVTGDLVAEAGDELKPTTEIVKGFRLKGTWRGRPLLPESGFHKIPDGRVIIYFWINEDGKLRGAGSKLAKN